MCGAFLCSQGNYRSCLELWQELPHRYGVDLHASVLMTNPVHFLATPETQTALSNTMNVVGSHYARHIIKKYKCTGTLEAKQSCETGSDG